MVPYWDFLQKEISHWLLIREVIFNNYEGLINIYICERFTC